MRLAASICWSPCNLPISAGGPSFCIPRDLVATRWIGRGTHEGELMGIQPTGKQVTVSGLTISRLEGDKIVEEFQN